MNILLLLFGFGFECFEARGAFENARSLRAVLAYLSAAAECLNSSVRSVPSLGRLPSVLKDPLNMSGPSNFGSYM